MISVSFFHVFIVNNWEKCPRGGVLARFYRPGGGGFERFFARGGEFTHQKNCLGGLPGGDSQVWNWLIHNALRNHQEVWKSARFRAEDFYMGNSSLLEWHLRFFKRAPHLIVLACLQINDNFLLKKIHCTGTLHFFETGPRPQELLHSNWPSHLIQAACQTCSDRHHCTKHNVKNVWNRYLNVCNKS